MQLTKRTLVPLGWFVGVVTVVVVPLGHWAVTTAAENKAAVREHQAILDGIQQNQSLLLRWIGERHGLPVPAPTPAAAPTPRE